MLPFFIIIVLHQVQIKLHIKTDKVSNESQTSTVHEKSSNKNLLRPVFETLRTTPISTSVEFNSIK